MSEIKTIATATTLVAPAAAALTTAKRKYEGCCAQAALARYAQEMASRYSHDRRNDRGAIEMALFANV